MPTRLPALLIKLALRLDVVAKAVISVGRNGWHEIVNRVDNRPADNVGKKTADEVDRLAPMTWLLAKLM